MPHNPIDYSKTIMYKLVCKDLSITELYIGQTTDFRARKNQHKSTSNNINNKYYNLNVYKFIRENGNWNNWEMIKIEDYPCLTKLDALKRERELIESLNATLNSNIPSRTQKEINEEYYENNKDKIKEWRENNKDKIKEWRENNQDKIKEYRENNQDKNKEKQKEYYQNNQDKIKEYYQNNKEIIAEKANMKVKCECGGCFTTCNKSIHSKTKKHLNWLASSPTIIL